MKKILFTVGMFASAMMISQTQTVFSEGFDTFSNLVGAGWTSTNVSSPLGASTWAQGGGTAFSTGGHQGGTTSFALCNYNSTTGAGTISNWLITPVVSLDNGDVISFYSRKGGTNNDYADRLEFRISTTGSSSTIPTSSTGVGSFTNAAITINPNLSTSTDPQTGYPIQWTQYSYTMTGLTASTPSRMAFRYFVENGGPSGLYSDIVGIDTFSVTRATMAVSEVEARAAMSVYPTMAEATVNVVLSSGESINGISIYDASGKALPVVKSDVVKANHHIVDVNQLEKGLYLINVLTKDKTYTSKFIKKINL